MIKRFALVAIFILTPSITFAQQALQQQYNPDTDAYAILQASQRLVSFAGAIRQQAVTQIQALNGQIVALKKDKDKADAQISTLQGQVKTRDVEIADLKTKLAQAKKASIASPGPTTLAAPH